MAMSTFQKVTLATCLVLCVALLLPKMLLSRGRKDAAERPDGSGRFPPMIHRQMAPDQKAAGSHFSRAHNPEAIARAKGAGSGPGPGTGGKSNLAGQIIPVYGFGILLYILYILFKITSKGKTKPSENKFPSVRSENMKRKITDFELTQLQEKLRETELVMEDIVSNAQHGPDRVKVVTADQEESLLQQLTEITRAMQEGQLMDGVDPETKVQDDWEDYPEEPHQYWERPHCCCHHSQRNSPQPEAQKTEAAGTDLEEKAEDVLGQGHHETSEDVKKDADREAVMEEDAGVNEKEHVYDEEEGQGETDLDVLKGDQAGVLEEVELSLKTSSEMEQGKTESVQPAETETACSHVRRRNRKRRVRKDSH
ncbi:hypothetical protein LDENG_00015700 [Lucifuga dentata]|nr:hypothetical protein LDENG_00015700 [Lucifuga dentata]